MCLSKVFDTIASPAANMATGEGFGKFNEATCAEDAERPYT